MGQHELQFAIQAAVKEASNRGHEYVTVEHLLYALIFEPTARNILKQCGAELGRMLEDLEGYFEKDVPRNPKKKQQDPKQTVGFRRVLERALLQVQSSGKEEVDGGDVLVSIRQEEGSHAAAVLDGQNITRLDLLNFISHGISKSHERDGGGVCPDNEEEAGGDGGDGPVRDPLKRFATCLTERARKGELDPLIGRGAELRRTMQVLCRRTKNNPVLVGDAGVGKTAIVEGLAQALARGDVPDVLEGCEIYALDLGSLLAGTKFRGQFEERFKAALTALERLHKPVLFIDEMHMMMGAGSASGNSMDVAGLLKPVLQSGKVRCIGATTHEDFRKHIERDAALVRRLQKIEIAEPSAEDAIAILRGIKGKYEEHHGVRYEDDALNAAVDLSARHIAERWLPDKAIDVMDEAGAANRMRPLEERLSDITKGEMEAVVAHIAGIPDLKAGVTERERLANIEEEIGKALYGQEDAVRAVADAVKLSRAGLGVGDQPVGAFLFVGPTGIGKTELAKQLAAVLGISFLRYDMSEYMEKHAVSRLIGAPPGYVGYDQGGILTSAIRKTPHCVLLLDEIEKAHPDLFDILLQVMDHAALTDNTGRTADFRNVALIMTSNAGAREMNRAGIGYGAGLKVEAGKREIERLFSPEFRNRLTEVVTFQRLTPDVMGRIVGKFVRELEGRLAAKGVSFSITRAATEWLASHGYDEAFGARPLKRLIQQTVHKPLADRILFGDLADGGTVTLDVRDDAPAFL